MRCHCGRKGNYAKCPSCGEPLCMLNECSYKCENSKCRIIITCKRLECTGEDVWYSDRNPGWCQDCVEEEKEKSQEGTAEEFLCSCGKYGGCSGVCNGCDKIFCHGCLNEDFVCGGCSGKWEADAKEWAKDDLSCDLYWQ